MLVECSRNVGWGFLEAACSTRADVAPGEITGSSFHHCLPFPFQRAHTGHTQIHTHTNSSGTFSAVSRGKSLRGKLTPSWRAVAASHLYRWFYLLLQGFMFVSLKLLPGAVSTLEVKCYKIKYKVSKIPPCCSISLVHTL